MSTCEHKSIVEVTGGTDCEDCPMTWRPNPEAEWDEFYFDPDDMYGSLKY